MSFSKCMEIVNSLEQEDQDAVLDKLAQYTGMGMAPERAQVAAVKDVLEELKAERADFVKLVEEQHPDYARRQVNFEVAPDPNDPVLLSAWRELDTEQRLAISDKVARALVPKVLKLRKASGAVMEQFGSYLDDTNPSFALKTSSDLVSEISSDLGYVLAQDSMMNLSDEPFAGAEEHGAVIVDMGDVDLPTVERLYSQLRQAIPEIGGQSFAQGWMTIINMQQYSGITTDDLIQKVDALIGEKYTVQQTNIYASFIEKDNYRDHQTLDGRGSEEAQANLWAGLDRLRGEAASAIRSELEAAGVKVGEGPAEEVADGGVQKSARDYPANAKLAKWVGEVRSGKRTEPGFILMDKPPVMAQMAGLFKEYPVVIKDDFVRHLGNKGRGEAEISADLISRLPEMLKYPRAMVMQKNNNEDSFQFFLDDRNDLGEPLLVVLKRSKLGNGRQDIRVVDIRTMFHKTQSMAYLLDALRDNSFAWMTEKEIAGVRAFTDEGPIPYGTGKGAAQPGAASSAAGAQNNRAGTPATKNGIARVQDFTSEGLIPYGTNGATPPQSANLANPSAKQTAARANESIVFGKAATVKFLAGNKDWKSAGIPLVVSEKAVAKARQQQINFSARDLGFYSELAKQIDKASMKQAPAAEWKSFIKALGQKGVKADEIEWSGINDWLDLQIGPQTHVIDVAMLSTKPGAPTGFGVYRKGDEEDGEAVASFKTRDEAEAFLGNGKVAKADVLAYLDANGVQVQETVLGNQAGFTQAMQERLDELESIRDRTDAEDDEFQDLISAENRASDSSGDTNQTKYGNYTLPGGANYREVLLTLPEARGGDRAPYDAMNAAMKAKYGDRVNLDMTREEQAEVRRLRNLMDGVKQGGYKSSHWDQKNVLAHLRVDDRADTGGNKVLMVQELQSDWGQDGKKIGFNTQPVKVVQKNGFWGTQYQGDFVASVSEEGAREAARNLNITKGGSVPVAPFVTKTDGWLNLALKRAIIMAVEGGYQKVAFVNGEQSADRYDLSKQVDMISMDGSYPSGYNLTAWKNEREITSKKVNSEFEAADMVGKDVAQKLFSQLKPNQQHAEVSGVDLKVGGEGMKAFYDQIVPNAVKALLKKLGGGKLEMVDLAPYDPNPELDQWEAEDGEGDGSMAAITEYRQPGFTITLEMAANVEAGLPLFSKRDPYGNAPDNLMGYRKNGPQAAFGEQAYKHVEFVRVSWDDGQSMVEAMTGLNKPHALERARRNWKDADIQAITRAEAEAEDPAIGRDVDSMIRKSVRSGTSTWDMDGESKFDDIVFKLQNKMIDVRRVIQSITRYTGQVADDINVYLQEELFHGRAAKRTEDFASQELKPLMQSIKRAGYQLADVEEYLQARHAPEANRIIAQRNPGDPNLQDGGSGMTNATAAAYMANLVPQDAQKLSSIAAEVDAIIAKTRQLYVDYGLESQRTVTAWGQMFQHYIPLQREDKEGKGGMGIGQGFSVKGKETRGRTGSKRKVVDVLANIALQRERLIVRGEKNRVSKALYGLVRANPNPEFWDIGAPPSTRVYDPKTNTVVNRIDPLFKSKDNVVMVKVEDHAGNIVEQAVRFNEDDPRAMRMAAALKNLDAGQLEGLWGVSAKITRYFSAINTQYNPVFGVVNLVRDVQGALVNLGATPLAKQKRRIALDTASALKGIYADIRAERQGRPSTSPWSQLFEDFQKEGGQTGFRDMFRTSADRAKDLEKTLNPDGWADSKVGKMFTANGTLKKPMTAAVRGAGVIFDWLSDYNLAMENGVRLAAYKAGLDQGMSKQQAASLAKNLTVNFNRKGDVGMQAGAVWAFFNAAMQGSARIGTTLFDMEPGKPKTIRLSRHGKKVVYGGMMLGSLQAFALMAAGFDDDDPPEFLRERSLIIPTGGASYLAIPMPLGLHVIPGMGRHITEFALGGFEKPAQRAVSIIGMFADAFNPIGNAGLSMQTLMPTAFDPFAALSENRDWTGKPIARTSMNKAVPGHTQWKDTATGPAKLLAEAINWASGGNDYVAGALSPTPDQIEYLVGQATGGVGRELMKVEQTIKALATGEELPTFKVPLAGRFFGNTATQSSQAGVFYANSDRLNALETEVKGLRKDGKFAEAQALVSQHPEATMLTRANVAERQIQRLRKEKRELIKQGAERAKIKQKENQITEVMQRLNTAMEKFK